MRFLILDTYYPTFLNSFYKKNPNLKNYPYTEQWRILMEQSCATANFYSSNLKKLGYEATEIIGNCEPIQKQWAKEQGIKLDKFKRWTICFRRGCIPWIESAQSTDWFYQIILAQVKKYCPDVFYVQDINYINHEFLNEIRPYTKLIVGQIACPISPVAAFSKYDLLLSSFPHFVEHFRKNGLVSEYFKIGFEPQILTKLRKRKTPYRTVFIGGLSICHAERIRFLEDILSSLSLDIWGYGINTLKKKSPIQSAYHGQAWGLDMYDILNNADIVINHHINVAEGYANNMRLYEATGVGTLLITDYKNNLHTLFKPDKEVITYRSTQECKELIAYYLKHDEKRKNIAKDGQKHTLEEHTYYHRMQELIEILTPIMGQRRKLPKYIESCQRNHAPFFFK